MSGKYYGYVYPLTVFGNEKHCHIETQGGFIPSIEQIENIIGWCNHVKSNLKTQKAIDEANEGLLEDMKEQARYEECEMRAKYVDKKQNFDADPCHIYILKDTYRGLFKIGKANNVENRLKQLKTANSGVELETWYFGAKKDEKILHSIFEEVRTSGEWFCLNAENLEFIRTYFEQKHA